MAKIICFVFLLLVGCNSIEKQAIQNIPWIQEIMDQPNLDPIVRQGLLDGCVTSSASRGNSFFKSTFYFRQDHTKVHDSKYMLAWKNGYGMCFPEANINSFAQFGARAVSTSHPAAWIQPFGQKAEVPVGGDAESKPAVWYFDQTPNDGIPTNAYYHNPTNIYGFFGSCFLC